IFVCAASAPGVVEAQGLTSQLSGTVTDSGGGVMPGVTIVLKNAGPNQVREAVTTGDGTFLFPDLLAGTYDISVKMDGFKPYEQKGIVVGATEGIGLKAIALQVGGLSEQIVVAADAPQVQTTNGSRSGLVTRQQIDDIA